MSIEEGYSRYACDRSERTHPDGVKPIEFLTPHDKRAAEWLDTDYVDANGVTRHVTLCPDCAPSYEKIKQSYADELNMFMNQ